METQAEATVGGRSVMARRSLGRAAVGWVTLLALVSPVGAGRVEELTRASSADGRAYDRLAWLTDRIGARLAGSTQAAAAQRWAASILRADGLEARLEKVVVPVWVRGYERAELVWPARQPLAAVALGGSVATPLGGVEAEVVEADSLEALDRLGEAARGKIVLFNRDMEGGFESGYGRVVGLRSRGPSEAARRGAVAMLLRSLGTAAYRLPHTGALNYSPEAPRIPAAAISEEDADLIHRLLAAGERPRVRLVLGCETRPEVEEANVVADLRGREKPAEIVLLAAHLDSWDLGTGAIDDGAGVAIVMEAMRLIKATGPAPRRTIRAVLFANEENGLAGGKTYAKTHAAELSGHVAAIESDSGGAAPVGWSATTGEGGLEWLRSLTGPLEVLGAASVEQGGGGADIGPMRSAGVPLIGLRQEPSRYFDFHHTAADTLDKVDAKELQANAVALAIMTWALAESPEVLPRVPPEKPTAAP